MKLPATLVPAKMQIWVQSFLPKTAPPATIPRPGHPGETLWGGEPLPFGSKWAGVPVTNQREFATAPNVALPSLSQFGVELEFTRDKAGDLVSVSAKALTKTGSLTLADTVSGAETRRHVATCRPQVSFTVSKNGANWTTRVTVSGRISLSPAVPVLGLNGVFVLSHTSNSLSEIRFEGSVHGFAAHECYFVLDNSAAQLLFQVPSDPEDTRELGGLFIFGRPVFFDLADEPPVTQAFLDKVNVPGSVVEFANAAEVDAWFVKTQGKPFHAWFNATLAGRRAWGGHHGMMLGTGKAEQRLKRLFDLMPEIFGTPKVPLMRLMALFTIVAHESIGFTRLRELADRDLLLKYFYEPKLRYDKKGKGELGNLSMHDLLSDPKRTFWNAHKARAAAAPFDPAGKDFAKVLAAWHEKSYPKGHPYSLKESESGFIMQADFYKFIGRGLLQLTGRSLFKLTIGFVKAFNGKNPTIEAYSKLWAGKDDDLIATESSVADWQKLFETDEYLSIMSIAIHARDTNPAKFNYLELASTAAVLNEPDTKKKGTLAFMARRINKSSVYRAVFLARIQDFRRAIRV